MLNNQIANHTWQQMTQEEQDEGLCLSLCGSLMYNEDGSHTILMGSKAHTRYINFTDKMESKYSPSALTGRPDGPTPTPEEMKKWLASWEETKSSVSIKGGLMEQIKNENKVYYPKLTYEMIDSFLNDLMEKEKAKPNKGFQVYEYCFTKKTLISRNTWDMQLCGDKACTSCSEWATAFHREMKALNKKHGEEINN